jgi:hypothetical protein
VQVNVDKVFTLDAAPHIEREDWHTGPGTVVLNYVVTPPSGGGGAASIGPPGTLQSSDGLGGFGAYTGSMCGAGLFMTGLLPTGLRVCGTPVFPSTTAHLLTDRAESLIPNAVNLAARPSGLLLSTVSGAVAAVSTVPLPAGGLAGLSGPQTLLQTFVPLRSASLPTTVTPLVIDLSATDLGSVSELQQNTLFADPIGAGAQWQLLWLSLHSTVPRALTWSAAWSPSMGIPLPTATTGGTTFDLLGVIYNPVLGKMVLAYNSQLVRPDPPGVVTGTFTCPATLSLERGQVIAITNGPCGGGGGGGSTPAGALGDIQLSGGASLVADSGIFSHDVASHTTYTQGLQAGAGSGYQEFVDAAGHKGWVVPSDLTGDRTWMMPDKSGTVAMLSDVAGGGGGNVSSTGTPTTGQLATWSDATHVQGVTALPAANEPAHTGDVTNTAGSLALTITPGAVTAPKMAPATTLRTCMLLAGADNGAALVDADLGPQLQMCLVPAASTVVEIVVYADAGTPNVLVHRRTGTTNTALLSGALATAASGALACSKTTGVAGIAGTTCSATLQNTSVAAGDTLGLSSGTAGGVAKRMSVGIVMTVN